ncbi:hypothetical protein Tco_1223127 [Tanacetum coccineum]
MIASKAMKNGECSTNPTDPITQPIITSTIYITPQKKQNLGGNSEKTLRVHYSLVVLVMMYQMKMYILLPMIHYSVANTAQDSELPSLKKRFKKLERRNKSRTLGLKRLRKLSSARRLESSDEASLGDQEDASKQGRKIAAIDADTEVTLVDETQGKNDEEMFDTCILDGEEVFAEQDVVEKEVSVVDLVTTVGEVVTTASVEVTTDNATTTTVDELTLAQTLIEIKAAKPKLRVDMIKETK